MSIPKQPPDVKLISSLFSSEAALIDTVISKMEVPFGQVDWVSEKQLFERTKYYAREMGWPLYRRFISFSKLIPPEAIVDIKLATNRIEREYVVDMRRRINIDPGYISLERLILATGKNYTHRVYLAQGIYADLTLVFHAGTFMPLTWTYPDYADEHVIACFNMVRDGYLEHLRKEEKSNYA